MENPTWVGCSRCDFCILEALLCDHTAPLVRQILTGTVALRRGDVSSEDVAEQS